MRITALLGVAAISAAALSAMAQSNVYSLNVVGYVNIPVSAAPSKMMIANQLNTTNNSVGSLLGSVPEGSQMYKWNNTFVPNTMGTDDNGDLVWSDPAMTLTPGEGAFFTCPSATTLTFVGEVMQGQLVNALSHVGWKKVMISSMVPQAGSLTPLLGVPAEDGDQVYTWNTLNKTYDTSTYSTDDNGTLVWQPDAVVNVGQAFFYSKAAGGTATSWVRNFTVQ